MAQASWPFERAVRDVVRLLVQGDFAVLASSGRCEASDLQRVVREYGRTLVMPPLDDAAGLDVVPVNTAAIPEWSVNAPLWTLEEGRSDLTLQLTVRERHGGKFTVEVDDLHVL